VVELLQVGDSAIRGWVAAGRLVERARGGAAATENITRLLFCDWGGLGTQCGAEDVQAFLKLNLNGKVTL